MRVLMVAAVGVVVAISEALGLVARTKLPYDLPRRQMYSSIFRVFVGLMVLVLVVLGHA